MQLILFSVDICEDQAGSFLNVYAKELQCPTQKKLRGKCRALMEAISQWHNQTQQKFCFHRGWLCKQDLWEYSRRCN